jgi:uncharacterized membrane protein YvbJ
MPDRVAAAQKYFRETSMTDGKMILIATAFFMVIIVIVYMFLESRKK